MLTTVTVSVISSLLTGAPVAGGSVLFVLDHPDVDIDDGFMAGLPIVVALGVDGTAEVEVWPNALGTLGSLTQFQIRDLNNQLVFAGTALIPNNDCLLHQVLQSGSDPSPVPGYYIPMAQKNAPDGVPGLTGDAINVKGVGATGLLTSLATAVRAWVLPDAGGVIALISDLAAYASKAVSNAFTGNQRVVPVALVSAANVVVVATATNNFRLALTADGMLMNPTGLADGMTFNFYIRPNGHALTFDTKYTFAGGITPTASTDPGDHDYMSCAYDATDDVLVCSYWKGGA